MKKLHLLLVLSFFAAMTFMSCKKDYTCNCTVSSIAIDTSFTFKTKIDGAKKKHAEAECRGSEEAYQQMASLLFGTASCELEKD